MQNVFFCNNMMKIGEKCDIINWVVIICLNPLFVCAVTGVIQRRKHIGLTAGLVSAGVAGAK